MAYNMLIKGGRVIDPSQGIDKIMDIAVSEGKIALLEKEIEGTEGEEVIDASGKIVTPGLIDLHTHVYGAVTRAGLSPDVAGVQSGVTTVCDAGTSGYATFGGFKRFTIPSSTTRVYCFLHICPTGLATIPEISDLASLNPEATMQTVESNRDAIKGIKIRAVGPLVKDRALGKQVLGLAKKVATEACMPLMVHIGDSEASPSESLVLDVLSTLEKGDILSHFYSAKPGAIQYEDREQVSHLRAAVGKGILLDTAHGRSHFSFEVAKRAFDQGILPWTISTDLTAGNRDLPSVHCLVETMSKFLALGLGLTQIIAMTTVNPARAMNMGDSLGSLEPGREADISILELVDGDWLLLDAEEGQKLRTRQALVPVMTVKSGKPIVPQVPPIAKAAQTAN